MNVVVLGASNNPSRFSLLAVHNLMRAGHNVWPVGIKEVSVEGLDIITSHDPIPDIDLITIYINETHQPEWYDFILRTHPKKIIFNPGSENYELATMAQNRNIEVMEACTLVLISENDL
jgi:predicted CoA-binding protein